MPWSKKQEEGKWCVYKDGEAKAITCHATEKEADDHIAALYANAESSLDAEVFAVGKWNGMTFTQEDIKGIADAFASLGDKMRVPLKFGHNNEQPITDGQPALGWVDKVWVQGEKLMARFVDMPKVVMDAIKKKRYRNVSIELDMNVMHMGQAYKNVLTGVALLGADIPAVNTLKDLTHYMSRDGGFAVGCHAAFSAIAGNITKESTMDLEKLQQQVTDLTVKVGELTTTNAKLTADNAELTAKVGKFTADKEAADKAAREAAIKTKREEITKILDAGVKATSITPAHRESFAKLLRVDDDAAVEAIDMEQVRAFANVKASFSRTGEQGGTGSEGDSNTSGESVDIRVDRAVKDEMAKNKSLTYMAAQELVFTRDPKLGREYIDNVKE